MRILRLTLLAAFCVLAACSKNKKSENQESALSEFAKKTAAMDSGATLAPLLEARGFVLVGAQHIPAQLSGRRATAMVYRSPDRTRGGVVYLQRSGNSNEGVTWHWFFDDGAPDSIQVLELNGDGLWDVRVFMAGGTTRDFIQGETFTLMNVSEGRFAMNGASSTQESWKAFDGDTATAWQSPSRDAFVDIPLPMGMAKGEIAVWVASGSHASKLAIYAGEKKVQEVDLTHAEGVQEARLDASLKDAPAIRVVVEGPDQTVAISELEIR